MADVDPFKDPPLYESTQVITLYDLIGIRKGYELQYHRTPRWRFRKRFMFLIGIGVCSELLHWLAHGKPVDGVQCRGEENYEADF